MSDFAKEITPVAIEDELKQSYLDYAMSVIVGRALPDVRDGLKPVHRRVLFAMHELGNDWNKSYKKSARVVGDVIGKYHPHGDSAVYDAIVRMAQPFSLRYMLVDGQGNFGSVDGDEPAAMRYTEVRMARMAHELLADLDKETVDWVANYDDTELIPAVLPTKIPNLLVNGSSGIAVGMATNIPPHNLREVVDACLALLDDDSLGVDDLMQFVTGPDFPTGGIIHGRAGIVEAYRTGRGRIHVRSRAQIETDEKTHRQTIIVTEIPYQVNKARLIEKIAELVKEKKIEGISPDGLRDESDKDGMRIVIELKRGEMAEVLLNNLYAQTPMESVFGMNMVALVDGQPRTLNLREFISAFLRHRREVVTRRTVFELRKARDRGHIIEGQAVALANIDEFISAFLRHRREVVTRRTVFELRKARDRGHIIEGQAVALANLDEVIELIKTSPSPGEAKERLLTRVFSPGMVLALLEAAGDRDACRPETLPADRGLGADGYRLSVEQAQAILDLRLHRLTGLEQDKLVQEYREILARIRELALILAEPARLVAVIRAELEEVKSLYGDARRTEIIASRLDLSMEDLIAEEDVVLTLSHAGYAKTQPLADYRAQKRGGRGKSATAVKDEDFIERLLVVSTHATVMCFTSVGKVYWLKVYEIPQAGRASKGKPIVNILPLQSGERITAILPLRDYAQGQFVFMATGDGTVKKVDLTEFSRPRSNGLIAINLSEGDSLVGVALTDGQRDIMLFSDEGKAVRFAESEVRSLGRQAMGMRGMTLPPGRRIVSLLVPAADAQILTACAKGYGKRTGVSEFPIHGRGGKGVIAIQTSDRNGALVAAVQVAADGQGQLMLISDQGTLVRTRVSEVSCVSRNTQGVTLIRLAEEEQLIGVVPVADDDAEDDGENEASEVSRSE